MPPSPVEFARCQPDLLKSYPLHWTRLATRTRPGLYDWDDRAVSRFSHPAHPFKILYLADGKETAFWEVFGADIEDMPIGNRALSVKLQLEPREWVEFEVPPDLRLIDVTQEKPCTTSDPTPAPGSLPTGTAKPGPRLSCATP